MAGGGTGGHIIPALAVARELRRRGHEPFFIGTPAGLEARLVPDAGFPIEWIQIGGLNRVGMLRKLRTLIQLPKSVWDAANIFSRKKPSAIFSMGGYVSGPVMAAAALCRLPIVLMEPNAAPGLANRRMAPWVKRALVNFPATAHFFPGRAEVTGVPVRQEFFAIEPREAAPPFHIVITGGSQGSRTLNRAARESWELFRGSDLPVRITHQTGRSEHEELARLFAETGLAGEVVPFISGMPASFAEADLIICRSGASTVSEVAAAGKPSILVPFPFAADDHQLRNAEAMAAAGAARLVLDREMNGERLFQEASALLKDPASLRELGRKAREASHPGAAERAASVLEQVGVR